MYPQGRSSQVGMGPIPSPLPVIAAAPLTGSGILTLTALGTTPVKVLSASLTPARHRRCKIVNLSATNSVSWLAVEKDAAAPSFTASGAITDGSIVLPSSMEGVAFVGTVDLYLVASAAATVAQISVVDL